MAQSWAVRDGSIVERPREVSQYPLLDAIYDRHDRLIGEHVRGRTLELAFGRHAHPQADVGVDAWPENARDVGGLETFAADARRLPFADDAFDTVVGRRFLHHVPPSDRPAMLAEARRVLAPGGRLVVLEGTPGLYRSVTKKIGFALGVLGEDNDEYSHLTRDELQALVADAGFDLETVRPLGSPIMPLSVVQSDAVRSALPLYERTQWVQWWTLIVASDDAAAEASEASTAGESLADATR